MKTRKGTLAACRLSQLRGGRAAGWVLALGLGVLSAGRASAEFLIFPHVDLLSNSGLDNPDAPYALDSEAAIDLFATGDLGRFRFLAEYFVAEDEHELERGQVGWVFGETSVWIGRFHNPIGYHNPQFHHGVFLQTGTARPAIVSFEDDNGVLPMHVTGLLAEGSHLFARRELSYSFGFGKGPEFGETGLEALDLLHPGEGEHDSAYTARLSLRAGDISTSELGVFASNTQIPSIVAGLSEIEQSVVGAYANWEGNRWQLVTEFYDISNELAYSTGTVDADFSYAYVQATYHFTDSWGVYSRIERTSDEDNGYLALFPGFVGEREILGLQYHIGTQQIIKLEFSRGHTETDDFGTATVSWGAVFP